MGLDGLTRGKKLGDPGETWEMISIELLGLNYG
jgi:hypothetical protein